MPIATLVQFRNMRITKKQVILTEKLLEIEKNIEEKVKRQRIENLARGMDWFEKIKLFFKI